MKSLSCHEKFFICSFEPWRSTQSEEGDYPALVGDDKAFEGREIKALIWETDMYSHAHDGKDGDGRFEGVALVTRLGHQKRLSPEFD